MKTYFLSDNKALRTGDKRLTGVRAGKNEFRQGIEPRKSTPRPFCQVKYLEQHRRKAWWWDQSTA